MAKGLVFIIYILSKLALRGRKAYIFQKRAKVNQFLIPEECKFVRKCFDPAFQHLKDAYLWTHR